MRLLTAEVTNFGSYTDLTFDFDNQGLALIYGATGSGKSTLQDVPSWIIFGVTAKDGNVDEIRSWNNLDEPTTGSIQVELADGILSIYRCRGRTNQNDLYWIENGNIQRGKDIIDTQKLLEQRLGVTKDLYIAACYYNEFSPTGSFFTDNAKNRRELFEKIANLSLPTLISEKVTNERRRLKKSSVEISERFSQESGANRQARKIEEHFKRSVKSWEETQARSLQELKVKSENFEDQKLSKLEALKTRHEAREHSKKIKREKILLEISKLVPEPYEYSSEVPHCDKCGQPIQKDLEKNKKLIRLHEEMDTTEPGDISYDQDLLTVKALENKYNDLLEQAKLQVNPFISSMDNAFKEIEESNRLLDSLKKEIDYCEYRFSGLDDLQELSGELRGVLLTQAVKEIEAKTNYYLETYFDSELRVAFVWAGTDDLDVIIGKSGHDCVYKQLSKGQRSLLKLCFSVSVMTLSANNAGLYFSALFMDEALDGLDTPLKLKSFNMFSELEKSYGTILIIDHSNELQSLFNKQYCVRLNSNDESTIRST